jgi:hypothetical protein
MFYKTDPRSKSRLFSYLDGQMFENADRHKSQKLNVKCKMFSLLRKTILYNGTTSFAWLYEKPTEGSTERSTKLNFRRKN